MEWGKTEREREKDRQNYLDERLVRGAGETPPHQATAQSLNHPMTTLGPEKGVQIRKVTIKSLKEVLSSNVGDTTNSGKSITMMSKCRTARRYEMKWV